MPETDQKAPKRLSLTQKIEALRTEFYTHVEEVSNQISVEGRLRANLGKMFKLSDLRVDDARRDINGLKVGNYAALALAGLALLVALVW